MSQSTTPVSACRRRRFRSNSSPARVSRPAITGIQTNDFVDGRTTPIVPTLVPRHQEISMLRTSVGRLGVVAFVVLVVSFIGSVRPAAAQAVRGVVLGTIADKTGGVLPGATVTVTNTDT